MSIFVDIEKSLGSFQLKVQFEAGNETLALLGASGSGKSMTLKCIAGIEKPDRGRIVVDDVVLFDSKKHINLPPQQRHTGLMFQNYALFPNMTVLQNIRAGASREQDKKKRETMVAAIMDSFGLTPLASYLPAQLSGGQQQRTALARILVSNPNVLLTGTRCSDCRTALLLWITVRSMLLERKRKCLPTPAPARAPCSRAVRIFPVWKCWTPEQLWQRTGIWSWRFPH